MPTTEPIFGWPIAAGPDPAKQYPAAVDQPFKSSLALDLKPQGVRGTVTAGDYAVWSYLSFAETSTSGGATLMPPDGIRADVAGLWAFTMSCQAVLAAGQYALLTFLETVPAAAGFHETAAQLTGTARLSGAAVKRMTAGQILKVQLNVNPGGLTVNSGQFQFERVAP
jgi:hypothetical protein